MKDNNILRDGQDLEPENSRALRMDEDIEIVDVFSGGRTNNLFLQIRVSVDINHYRQFGLPNPHRPGSRFWNILPYDIAKHYLFDYLLNIETFIHIYPGATMHLYAWFNYFTNTCNSISASIHI